MTHNDLIDDLRSRINPAYSATLGTESYERRLCVEALETLMAERDALAAQLQEMREVVQYYWGNGPTSSLYYKARDALTTPDTSAQILARRDAAIWQKAAEVCKAISAEETRPAGKGAATDCEDALRAKADELLKGLEKEHG